MKALVYSDWDRLEVTDVPDPTPEAGEVLVRVEACGICGSELECFASRSPRRTPPLILGHEFCGRVEALGDGAAGLKTGDPVVVNSIVPCGECLPCGRGAGHLCTGRQLFGMHRPGACAEFVTAPALVVYPRPADMDPVSGALVEPGANGVHVMQLLPGRPRRSVFVIGAGVIGLMALQAARALHGARVAVADLSPERLDCATALGAEKVVNAAEQDIVKEGIAFSGEDGVDYVVDAVGVAETKRQSLRIARPGGAVCWIGLGEDPMQLDSYDLTLPERIVTGSYAANREDMLEAMRLLHQGKMRGGDWVKTFPLADAADAFRSMVGAKRGNIKAIVLP